MHEAKVILYFRVFECLVWRLSISSTVRVCDAGVGQIWAKVIKI